MKWFLLALASACPGTPPCSGKGVCDAGACLCDQGFGGSDCSTEVPLYMEVTAVGPPKYQNMLGRYKLDGMYLMETPNPNASPDLVKFIHYDPASNGWAVSKFNSTCIDDICFFAYAPNTKIPPKRGYVFGALELHVYYKQLVFDEADKNLMLRPGYRLSFAYAPDATVPQYAALSEYNGRYVLQPRYVHVEHQKYAIFPITFNSPGKKWVVSGLLGEPRTRQILLTAKDPSENRYMPPQGPWLPDLGFVIKPACSNHVGDSTCALLKSACNAGNQGGAWIQQCCRDTCNSCQVSRALCTLPMRHDPVAVPTISPADPIVPPMHVLAVPTAVPAPAPPAPTLVTQTRGSPIALFRRIKAQTAMEP